MTETPHPGTVEALLPCPFCGGKAERIDIADGENAGGSCISCTRCMASGNVEFGFKENFVSNWNRRPALASTPTPQAPVATAEVEQPRKEIVCPGRYLIQHPSAPMSNVQRAWEMWAVHPHDLDALGMTREAFFLAHLDAAALSPQKGEGA